MNAGVRRSLAGALRPLALAAALLGCDDREARARAEARTFLSLYEATDHRAPIAERERKIAQLEQLTLSEDAVKKARDECVGAHQALIRAERENEGAAAQLDKALSGQPGGDPLPATETESIRKRIDGAERALVDSRKRFESCESEARGLSLRFGKR